MAWLYTVLNLTKTSQWSLMDLVQLQMQSIHGLAIHSPESNKSSRWSLMDLVQLQMQSIHGLAIHSPESNKISRWSLMDLVQWQSYKSYYVVSPQTVSTYPFHHAKLQILLHGVTANSLYYVVSPQTVSTYPFHHAKLQILLRGVTANSTMIEPIFPVSCV